MTESASAARVRAPLPDRVDVAVIGAGLGGLVAAARLASAGRRVAVFDAHYVAGGCATMFTRRAEGGRYHFDVGLHYIGDCGPEGSIPRILAELGISLRYRALDPDGFDTLVFPDFRFRIPANVDLYRERLLGLFPHERRGIDAYVRLLREVAHLVRTSTAKPPPGGLRMLYELALRGRLAARYRGATMADFLAAHIRDPKLAAVILGQSGDYGLPPSKVSALMHTGLANHYFQGAYYPVGGGQVIADALVAHIEARGGSVHLRAPVERVLVEGGRAVGVRVGGTNRAPTEVRAAVTISNADLKRTLLELVGTEALPPKVTEQTRAFEMAGALFMVFVGVKGDLRARGLTDTNYWSFDGYDVEAFYRAGLSPDGTPRIHGSYITSGSLKDPDTPDHAPAGYGTVEVMALVPGDAGLWGVEPDTIETWRYRRSEAYAARKAAVEAGLLARLEALAPGISADIVYRESATPVTHARFTRASGGTGYGLASTPAQFMQGRPGYRGPLPGLYLAGANTRAGHGIVGAMRSGEASAKRVLADLEAGE